MFAFSHRANVDLTPVLDLSQEMKSVDHKERCRGKERKRERRKERKKKERKKKERKKEGRTEGKTERKKMK